MQGLIVALLVAILAVLLFGRNVVLGSVGATGSVFLYGGAALAALYVVGWLFVGVSTLSAHMASGGVDWLLSRFPGVRRASGVVGSFLRKMGDKNFRLAGLSLMDLIILGLFAIFGLGVVLMVMLYR